MINLLTESASFSRLSAAWPSHPARCSTLVSRYDSAAAAARASLLRVPQAEFVEAFEDFTSDGLTVAIAMNGCYDDKGGRETRSIIL